MSRRSLNSSTSIGTRSVSVQIDDDADGDMPPCPEMVAPLFRSFEEHDRLVLEEKVSVLKKKEKIYFDNAASVIRSNSRIELSLVTAKRKPYLKEPKINKKCLEFLEAVELGDFEKVRMIYSQEKSLNLETKRGVKKWTPLIMAVYHGHLDIVKLLINLGADVMVEDKDGLTPLMHAVSNLNRNPNPHLIIRAISDAVSYKRKRNSTICLI